VVVAYVAVMFVLFVPAVAYAGRPLAIGAADVIEVVWRPVAASVSAAGVTLLIRWTALADMPPLARVMALGAAYLLVYVVLAVGVLRFRSPIRTTQSLVRGSSWLQPRAEQIT
jgi:PST family polysaccharide transporter